MKSSSVGNNTLEAEVTNVSPHGIWLIVHDREYFLPYDEFPWFQSAPVRSVFNVHLSHKTHLFWPDLDIDLHLDMFSSLQSYPLVYR